jgi:UDP-N-acetylmuramate dehydrogenase
MAQVREQVALSEFTTIRLGGPARRFVPAATDEEIIAEVRAADERAEPLLVLGGGSNLVISDDGFPGTVIHVATQGIRRENCSPADAGRDGAAPAGEGADVGVRDGSRPSRGRVTVTVAAGEDWDTVVASCVAEGLAGLECLSGIPGLAGATPIQNVGAYGQEVAETITLVQAYDRARGEVVELAGRDCGFGYRTSAFKRSAGRVTARGGLGEYTGRFVVLNVVFGLDLHPLSRPVGYRELAQRLGVAEGEQAPLGEVRAAVLALRRGKGMVLDPGDPDSRSAGSFFVNPVLDAGQFAALQAAATARCGPDVRIPRYPADPGHVKVSAAWLIEQAGFRKGYRAKEGSSEGAPDPGLPGARISAKHTLALVNPGGASTVSLLSLAREVRDGVRDIFGVELANEPVLVGNSL